MIDIENKYDICGYCQKLFPKNELINFTIWIGPFDDGISNSSWYYPDNIKWRCRECYYKLLLTDRLKF